MIPGSNSIPNYSKKSDKMTTVLMLFMHLKESRRGDNGGLYLTTAKTLTFINRHFPIASSLQSTQLIVLLY